MEKIDNVLRIEIFELGQKLMKFLLKVAHAFSIGDRIEMVHI